MKTTKSDKKSVEFVQQILKNNVKSMKNLKISSDQYCPYDLYTDTTLIEVKQRYTPSWSFDDNVCEYFKVQKINDLIQSGQYKKAYLISTYTDGVIRISALKDGDIILRDANHNTYFSDKNIIEKQFYSIKNFKDYILKDGKLILKI